MSTILVGCVCLSPYTSSLKCAHGMQVQHRWSKLLSTPTKGRTRAQRTKKLEANNSILSRFATGTHAQVDIRPHTRIHTGTVGKHIMHLVPHTQPPHTSHNTNKYPYYTCVYTRTKLSISYAGLTTTLYIYIYTQINTHTYALQIRTPIYIYIDIYVGTYRSLCCG